jgi:hypothetical protein
MPPSIEQISFSLPIIKEKPLQTETISWIICGTKSHPDFIKSVIIAESAKRRYPKRIDLQVKYMSVFEYDNLIKTNKSQNPHLSESTGAIVKSGKDFINFQQFENICSMKFAIDIPNEIKAIENQKIKGSKRVLVNVEIAIDSLPVGSLTIEVILLIKLVIF